MWSYGWGKHRNWLQLLKSNYNSINCSVAINGRNNTNTWVWNGNFLTKPTQANMNQWSEQNLMTPVYTCRALWLDSMPWFRKQAIPRLSGKLPVFQSDVAPLSMTHCTNKETEKITQWWLFIPAWPYDSWPRHASSCRLDHGHLERFLSHRWRWQHCLSSTRHSTAWRTITQYKWFIYWRKSLLVRPKRSMLLHNYVSLVNFLAGMWHVKWSLLLCYAMQITKA